MSWSDGSLRDRPISSPREAHPGLMRPLPRSRPVGHRRDRAKASDKRLVARLGSAGRVLSLVDQPVNVPGDLTLVGQEADVAGSFDQLKTSSGNGFGEFPLPPRW